MSFKGKVVLVTGVGCSVGTEIAHHFSKLGACLAVTDYRISSDFRIESLDSGSNCLSITADLTKPEDVFNVVNRTISKYTKLDILVNCIGVLENAASKKKKRTTLEIYDRSMNINVRAIYQLIILATPHLVKTKGNIVNVCGLNSVKTLPYRVARAALEQLTASLALSHVVDGVRVNSVTPNVIDDTETVEREIAASSTRYPSGLQQEPKRVADAVVLVVSDLASHITGADLPVNVRKHQSHKMEEDDPRDARNEHKEPPSSSGTS